MKLDNQQIQTIGATLKSERNPANHTTRYQDSLYLSKNNSWIFGPSFLKEEPCFEMNNNHIIVQTQQSNTQNKNPNSFINNTSLKSTGVIIQL